MRNTLIAFLLLTCPAEVGFTQTLLDTTTVHGIGAKSCGEYLSAVSDRLNGWKRALVRIVERSHPDCRKTGAPLSGYATINGPIGSTGSTVSPGSARFRFNRGVRATRGMGSTWRLPAGGVVRPVEPVAPRGTWLLLSRRARGRSRALGVQRCTVCASGDKNPPELRLNVSSRRRRHGTLVELGWRGRAPSPAFE